LRNSANDAKNKSADYSRNCSNEDTHATSTNEDIPATKIKSQSTKILKSPKKLIKLNITASKK
jgi:hypothetical protein